MSEELYDPTQFECRYCGLTPPKGHWRPTSWLLKHEANCPRNPKHNQIKSK